jgi:MscS family membrane protein
LSIEVNAWFQTSGWDEFTAIREETLLRFMAVVEGAGTAFAFPTRTVHFVREQGSVGVEDEPLTARLSP